MSETSTYYLGWFSLPDNSWYFDPLLINKHIYAVKDLDGDLGTSHDQTIIRGTAENFDIIGGNYGVLYVEDGETSFDSLDGLNNFNDDDNDGYKNNDKDKDGQPDNTVDRHYTQVSITDAQWNTMLQMAADIEAAEYDYGIFGANCQAVVVSILSCVGLDFEDNVPDGSIYLEYVSRNILLSGAGSDTLYGFDGSDFIYDKYAGDDTSGGSDNFHGGDAANQVRFDLSDGRDTVHYMADDVTGTLKVYDTFRAMEEDGGDIDVLYSIEKVRFENYDPSNTLDYSLFNNGIKIQNYNNDLLYA